MGTIGSRLREERERLQVSQSYLGSLGGVTGKTQGLYELDKRRPDAEYLAAVAHTIDILYVVTGEYNVGGPQSQRSIVDANIHTLEFVPRYSVRASAGPGNHVYDEEVTHTFAFRRDWLQKKGLKPENLSIISVQGDSMSGVLEDGDLVLLDTSDIEIKSGNAYVVRIDGELVVKYLQRLPGDKLQLSSHNQKYPPFTVDGAVNVDVVGRVVCSSHEW